MGSMCFNQIKVYGPERRLKTIQSVINQLETKGLYESLVGINPKCVDRSQHLKNAYNMNMEYWGNPKDYLPDENFYMHEEEGSLEISMITNHSPCDSFFVHLCEMYGLHGFIVYDNEEMDFYGTTTFSADGQWEDNCYLYLEGQYKLRPDDFWENLYNNQFEYWFEEDADVDEELKENFAYLSPEDKREVLSQYTEYKNQ